MGRFLGKRALQGLVVVWGVVTVVFALRYVTPGSPVDFIAPLDASQATRQRIAASLGLDRPLYVQYLDYVANLLTGDMGYSYRSRTPVRPRVLAKVPATLELALAATAVAVALSIPLGVVSATHRHSPADYGATLFSLLGISTPNFWLGVMLVIVLAVQFELFPTSTRPVGLLDALGNLVVVAGPQQGYAAPLNVSGFLADLRSWLLYITLPAITLGTYFTALITRLTRSGMLDQLGQGYVRAARAKGLPETLVRYRHALRNTLIPVITVVGLQLGTLVGGAVITEAVFDWPGLGTLVIDAIGNRDWPLIQGCLVVIGIGFVFVNIVVDALYATLDPQVMD
ncbi:ABC transporter permease [Halosimplex pelagicum]|uniref:ABC transporter permease n=1 Tax=Halosimplex pelagicum TaxID=869886 RepID=A0A7D5PCT5_9EURY|nr:ABC transporter permease [Halosimplex pelagicum]QLH85024.1 ABC transporter permease [Halosimplex pelagicum]